MSARFSKAGSVIAGFGNVTQCLRDTTYCHDIFRYCLRKRLILRMEFSRLIGRRYALKSKVVYS